MSEIDFSIIIPHRNSLKSLYKLLFSIPKNDRLEIIVVDNSQKKLTLEDIGCIPNKLCLIYSDPCLGAGGARNEGLKKSQGSWILFADADDYFAESAFDTFYKYFNSNADIVFFCSQGIYLDSGEFSDRGERYCKLVNDYLDNHEDQGLRLNFSVPWAKMYRANFIKNNSFKFDEVVASNDEYFSLLTGYYAKDIRADKSVVYIVTVSKGSLTQRINADVIFSRFEVTLRVNKFLKGHDKKKYQRSIMYFLFEGMSMGLGAFYKMIMMIVQYRQNPFVGMSRWLVSYRAHVKKTKMESKYLTK